jgi:hypothetical protein
MRREGSFDTRWFAGLHVGAITLLVGVGLLSMYKVDPALLYGTRVAAMGAVLATVASVLLLLQGISTRSRRLKMIGFWLVLVGNVVLGPLLGVAIWRALQLTPAPPPAEEGSEAVMVESPAVSEPPAT